MIETDEDENRKITAGSIKEAWWSEKLHKSQRKPPFEYEAQKSKTKWY